MSASQTSRWGGSYREGEGDAVVDDSPSELASGSDSARAVRRTSSVERGATEESDMTEARMVGDLGSWVLRPSSGSGNGADLNTHLRPFPPSPTMPSRATISDEELDRLYELQPKDTATARSTWFQTGIARCKQNPAVPIGESDDAEC